MSAFAGWSSLSHIFVFQIVGHSLGGGTAALLTYILREQKEFSSSTCVTFAPGKYFKFSLVLCLM